MSPRRKSVNIVRNVGPDPRFGLESVQKFINVIMWRGKKDTARRMLYGAMDIIIKKSSGKEDKALEVFHRAIFNATPLVEVRAKRIGGSVYQIPREVSENRGRSLAFRSLIAATAERKGKSFAVRLADELLDAADNKGGAVKIKLDKHKMADANKAFAHYAR